MPDSPQTPDAIAAMRRNYAASRLTETDAGDDPLALFRRWFDEARSTSPGPWYEANAMTLATAPGSLQPSARIVLLKDLDDHGRFTFFTNYHSRKAHELDANPQAALVFHWPWLERQVRIEGAIEKTPRTVSEDYFRGRPRGSQLGAWVSDQSSPTTSEALAARLDELQSLFADRDIPCPPYWGGYFVLPRVIEFWQGRPDRLHDRLEYRRDTSRGPGGWSRQRLGP